VLKEDVGVKLILATANVHTIHVTSEESFAYRAGVDFSDIVAPGEGGFATV
jgi:hypothetical protein